MLKTTVYLPDDLDGRLAAESRATGVSKAELIRRAVLRLLDESTRPRTDDSLPVFTSGRILTPEQMDDEIYAQMKERTARRVIVVADTSALFAAFDATQPEHAEARQVMLTEQLLISPLVLTELDHLTRRDLGFSASLAIQRSLMARMDGGQYRLADLKTADLDLAHQVRLNYPDLALDLADAVGMVLADRQPTNQIFTLDQRYFRVVKPLSRYTHFRLLPADGPDV